MPVGRPDEGRVRLNIHVLPETAEIINSLVNKTDGARNTQGKIVDLQFEKKITLKKSGASRRQQ